MNNLMGEKISVIIPAYNEEERIYSNIKKVETVLDDLSNKKRLDYEIIIVNDGSIDATYKEALKAREQNHRIIVIDYTDNGGKGNALRKGFDHTSGQYIFFLDADLDISPEHIPNFFNYLEETNADVVVGSKRHPDSNINYPFSRKILSELYQLINFGLFRLDLSDTQTGFKVFRYEVLQQVFPNVLCKKYAFDLELLVNANHGNWKIVEHPIEIDWKRNQNRVSLKDIWQITLDTAAIFYRLKILKHYSGPYRIISPKIHKVYDVLYDGISK